MSWFERSAEQDELRATLRRFLVQKSDEQAVRAQLETDQGYDGGVWQALSQQLGVAALTVPESQGGLGLGQVDLAIAMGEAGRSLLCAPLLSTVVLGLDALVASDDPACADLIERVIGGEATLALALAGAAAPWSGVPLPVASGSGDVRSVRGEVPFVLDGASADHLLVLCDADEGPTLVLVDGDAGVVRSPMPTLDLTRRQARLALDGATARVVGTAGAAQDVVAAVATRARVALAAESAGVCRQLLEMAVDYAKVRQQFDRPIGSFQAVKHLCTEMLVATELAESAAQAAAGALDAGSDKATLLSFVAAAAAADACDLVAAEAVQVHGGIGFTWEHPLHLFHKRAVSSARLWGTATQHRSSVRALLRADGSGRDEVA